MLLPELNKFIEFNARDMVAVGKEFMNFCLRLMAALLKVKKAS